MPSVEPKREPDLERRVAAPTSASGAPRDGLRGRARAAVDRFRNRFTIAVVYVVLPLLMVPALIGLAPSVTGAWAATHGRGAHGTFTSYERNCDDVGTSLLWPKSCTLTGIFDPADGSFPIDATLNVSSHTMQVSGRPVVAPGANPVDGTAVYVPGSRGWIEPVTLELTAFAALVAWAVLVVRAVRERQRHRRMLATPGYVDGGRHRRGTTPV